MKYHEISNYGVDSQIYRSGDKIKTSEDYIIVGNLPKRCYNKTRGSCSLRPEFYENLDSPHKNTAGLMANDSSYSRAMFPSERFSEREVSSRDAMKRYSDVEEEMERRDEAEESEDIERRRGKNREMMEKMMGGDSKEYEYEYEEEE